MPYLQNVLNFVGVMIHTGNTAKNTRGFTLVGRDQNDNEEDNDNYRLNGSRIQFNRLYAQIAEAIDNGEEVWISIRSPREWEA